MKDRLAYLKQKNVNKTEIIETNHAIVQIFLQNENPNSKSNISLTNNKKITKSKIWIENEEYGGNLSLLAKENNKDKDQKNEKKKPKLKISVIKKALFLGDSIIKNVYGWILNQRMKPIVSFCSISGATAEAMKHHLMRGLDDESPKTILLHDETNDLRSDKSTEKIVISIVNVALSAKYKKRLD